MLQVATTSRLFADHKMPHRLDGPLWHLVRSKPNQERIATDAIRALGITVYCPRFLKVITHAGRVIESPRALFPGYLFASAGSWFRQVRTAHGVSDILRRDIGGPLLVLDEVIQDLRAQENSDGYIDAVKEDREPEALGYVAGERVRIVDPLSVWHKHLVDFIEMKDSDRAMVSARLFGSRHHPMEVGLKDLERIAARTAG